MNKLNSILFATVLVGAAASSVAADNMGMEMDMKMMDTNKDGMISKHEFMKYHEAMWAKMKKNKSGMVDMNDMGMMQGGMMKGDAMTKGDGMMKGDSTMKGDGMMKGDGKMKSDQLTETRKKDSMGGK